MIHYPCQRDITLNTQIWDFLDLGRRKTELRMRCSSVRSAVKKKRKVKETLYSVAVRSAAKSVAATLRRVNILRKKITCANSVKNSL